MTGRICHPQLAEWQRVCSRYVSERRLHDAVVGPLTSAGVVCVNEISPREGTRPTTKPIQRKDHDMKKAKLRVTRIPHSALIQRAITMKACILKNADMFPEIADRLPKLDALLAPFVEARQEVAKGRMHLRKWEAASRTSRKELEYQMSTMADY